MCTIELSAVLLQMKTLHQLKVLSHAAVITRPNMAVTLQRMTAWGDTQPLDTILSHSNPHNIFGISLRAIFVLFSDLLFDHSSECFPPGLSTKILYAFLHFIHAIHMSSPSYFRKPHFLNNIRGLVVQITKFLVT